MNKYDFRQPATSVLCGVIFLPLCISGWKYISTATDSDIALIFWGIVSFQIPLLISTSDPKYIWQAIIDPKARSQFLSEEFQNFYLSTYKRMLLWMASGIFSVLVFKFLGLISLD